MTKTYKTKISPQQDAGWGLIYRLNDLWAKVDRFSVQGKYKEWNFLLDKIYCNLLYRNPIDVIEDSKGKVTGIKLIEDDSFVIHLEQESDKLFLDIFNFCWNNSSSVEQSNAQNLAIVENCFTFYTKKVQKLIDLILVNVSYKIPDQNAMKIQV